MATRPASLAVAGCCRMLTASMRAWTTIALIRPAETFPCSTPPPTLCHSCSVRLFQDLSEKACELSAVYRVQVDERHKEVCLKHLVSLLRMQPSLTTKARLRFKFVEFCELHALLHSSSILYTRTIKPRKLTSTLVYNRNHNTPKCNAPIVIPLLPCYASS